MIMKFASKKEESLKNVIDVIKKSTSVSQEQERFYLSFVFSVDDKMIV